MKKRNWIMRIALVVLVLTLATACMVSGTFAKYVTTSTGTDKANVAAWGVAVNVNGFAAAFDVDAESTYSTLYDTDTMAAAASATSLVAPGTAGDFEMGWGGKAEVPFTIAIDATVEYGGTWIGADGTSTYAPIVWTVDSTPYTDVADVEAAIEGLVTAGTVYNPSATAISETTIIAWAWDFAGNDADDTMIGLYAANVGKYVVTAEATVSEVTYTVGQILDAEVAGVTTTEIEMPTITMTVAITATQVDAY